MIQGLLMAQGLIGTDLQTITMFPFFMFNTMEQVITYCNKKRNFNIILPRNWLLYPEKHCKAPWLLGGADTQDSFHKAFI